MTSGNPHTHMISYALVFYLQPTPALPSGMKINEESTKATTTLPESVADDLTELINFNHAKHEHNSLFIFTYSSK